jgi:hypothetical protein
MKIFEEPPRNAKSMKGGVLPVAILGTAGLDVTDIDVSSLLLAGVAPIRHDLEDVTTPVNGDECDCTTDGPDGFTDLTLKFKKSEIAAAIGPVADGDVVVLNLTGILLDGTPLVGSDCVRILGKKEVSSQPLGVSAMLYPASPNPFNPTTRIRYAIPTEDFVSLNIYNVRGKLVETLVSRHQGAGEHMVEWDAGSVPSGVYFYRLRAGDFTDTRKVILLK